MEIERVKIADESWAKASRTTFSLSSSSSRERRRSLDPRPRVKSSALGREQSRIPLLQTGGETSGSRAKSWRARDRDARYLWCFSWPILPLPSPSWTYISSTGIAKEKERRKMFDLFAQPAPWNSSREATLPSWSNRKFWLSIRLNNVPRSTRKEKCSGRW